MFVLIRLFALGFRLGVLWTLQKFFLVFILNSWRVVSYILLGSILRFNESSITPATANPLPSIFIALVNLLKRLLFDFVLPFLFLSFDHFCHVFLHLLIHLVRAADNRL